MQARRCDECGGTLNATYPLRLVAEGGPAEGPTVIRQMCLGCIESATAQFEQAGKQCPACSDLAGILGLVIEAVQRLALAERVAQAITVPPNRHPHREDCPFESHAKDSV